MEIQDQVSSPADRIPDWAAGEMVTEPAPAPEGLAERGDSEPNVVIITVTYNSADVVEPFLRSLSDALEGVTGARVIVVDNASEDDTVKIAERVAPWATVLQAGANVGYGAGINIGLRQAFGRFGALVLNPDIVASRGTVRRLVDAVMADTVGISVPRILDESGQLALSLRREPTILRALGEAVLGGRRAARFPRLTEVVADPAEYVDGATADWATGACMFISRDALDKVGYWAADFFLYSEETDYALRCRDAGLGLRYVCNAVVVHRGGALKVSPWLWSIQAVNRTKFYRRRHSRIASAAFWSAVVLNEAIRSVGGNSTNRAALRALLRGGVPYGVGEPSAPSRIS